MTAARELAPFNHAPNGLSFGSKRGAEHFRRTHYTYLRVIKHRGAPMSPTGAAITPEALGTGLREWHSDSTVNVGLSGGADTLR